ncbi:MAG: EamA family transporter RarD [Opitutaceae bacterium]
MSRLQGDDSRHSGSATGIWAALGAFFLWGVLAIYWKQFEAVPPVEVIAHRVVWSLVLVLAILPLRGRMGQFCAAFRSGRMAGLYFVSGALLTLNWLTFVYAVQRGQIVDASLGYFLNPLFSVALGALVLRERLGPVQWIAVALAAVGVLVQIAWNGSLPWVSLVLAGTFALYGLLRKQGPLGSLTGLAVETALVAPLAIGYLVWMHAAGGGVLFRGTGADHAWAISTGVVTTIPLLLFATAARRLPLTTVGLCQYLAPTLQLAIGVILYAEPFGAGRSIAFVFIWAGLVLYTIDGLRRSRNAGRERRELRERETQC